MTVFENVLHIENSELSSFLHCGKHLAPEYSQQEYFSEIVTLVREDPGTITNVAIFANLKNT